MKFLELYFGGALMKDAARAAGYQGASDQALCNTARAILTKFSMNSKTLLRRARAWRKIAQLFDMAENSKSEMKKIKALKAMSKYTGG
jgi:hypothetical protein